MKVHRRVVGRLQTNCYIVEDEASKKCIVIDPGGDGQGILDFIDSQGLELHSIVITHGHIDHFLDAGYIQAKTSVPVLIAEADSKFLEDPGWMRAFAGTHQMIRPAQITFVKEGDVISFGNTCLRVIETPGHSPGSVCLYWPGNQDTQDSQGGPGVLFSGDLIFRLSVGRTDFPGGDAYKLVESIRNKVFTLPDDTIIYPGHDEQTTVGRERTQNPFVC
ncbi:MAG: MBL fold metallo-hydrolase [Bacillota bacterium]|nr:MBL fold metallo-hydrolase [Candidatus Fermentithermobacillaceae bacterium]HOA71023.1 MBL fold metallo-hydrolase [Bacillota bacterium]HOP70365.1 MBL fold metallo-hydrolase [Bacillota bacterium]HPT36369.1 MBL fold metallo-hydrolase [Bacillota bacterium]HPZ85430.1 MBL fold metallo-hydrolase [Bacillota bacterium]